MKQPYNWDYTIRVKTKEGTFEYEDTLENIGRVLQRHPSYEEVQAIHNKPKTLSKKRTTQKRKNNI